MSHPRIPHKVEALLYDYDAGRFAYQSISPVFQTHNEAKLCAYLDHFDHPTARTVAV